MSMSKIAGRSVTGQQVRICRALRLHISSVMLECNLWKTTSAEAMLRLRAMDLARQGAPHVLARVASPSSTSKTSGAVFIPQRTEPTLKDNLAPQSTGGRKRNRPPKSASRRQRKRSPAPTEKHTKPQLDATPAESAQSTGESTSDLPPHRALGGFAQTAAALVAGAPTSSSGVGRLGDGGRSATGSRGEAMCIEESVPFIIGVGRSLCSAGSLGGRDSGHQSGESPWAAAAGAQSRRGNQELRGRETRTTTRQGNTGRESGAG